MIPTTRCRLAPGSRRLEHPDVHNFGFVKILGTSRTSRTSSLRWLFHTLPTCSFLHSSSLSSCISTAISMHFHALRHLALPSLFHRSSIALPPSTALCRKRLRLILRGGGCNRVPLLLFSRLTARTHQHQHPTASLNSSSIPRHSFYSSSSFLHRVPSRSRSSSPFVITSLSSSCLPFATRRCLGPHLSRSSTLCVVPSKVSTPTSAALLAARTHASVRTALILSCRSSTLCVVPSKPPHFVIHTRSSFDP